MTTQHEDSFFFSGGRRENRRATENKILWFDTATRTFQEVANMGRSRHSHVAFIVPNCCVMDKPVDPDE